MALVCKDLPKLQEGKELELLATPVRDHRKVQMKENRKEGREGKRGASTCFLGLMLFLNISSSENIRETIRNLEIGNWALSKRSMLLSIWTF